MRITKLNIAKSLLIMSFAFFTIGCSEDDNQHVNKPDVDNTLKTGYYVAIQLGQHPTTTDVLVPAKDLISGKISPENNGYKQPVGFMSFMSSGNKIIAADYNNTKTLTSYTFKEGKLKKGESLSTTKQVISNTFVDSKTMILVASDYLGGYNKQEIYVIDVESMSITKTKKIELENNEATNTSAMPNGVIVKGNKLFISFHNVRNDEPRAVSLPAANTAKIAVYDYPELTFDKLITDTRCPNVGRYASSTVLQEDENGDIYTYATSSILSGYAPIPPTNSGILRIKKGTSEFDKDFHIDFEEISKGFKINDLYYVANGKAIVRVVKEDETLMASSLEAMKKFAWGVYSPTIEKSFAGLQTGILDLNAKTFKLLPNVAASGGSFASPVLIEGTKAYVGVSCKDYADIYIIDTEAGTATKGAEIDGNYAKGIFKVTE